MSAAHDPEQSKLISNYANGIAHTPLDPAVADRHWIKPQS